MLAAFRRVYDRGDRNSTRSQQLGLVIMDEAFSKLSGDGIEDCLSLARSFQLQLVMAFPPERLGVMVPHAQTVIMCQKGSRTRRGRLRHPHQQHPAPDHNGGGDGRPDLNHEPDACRSPGSCSRNGSAPGADAPNRPRVRFRAAGKTCSKTPGSFPRRIGAKPNVTRGS